MKTFIPKLSALQRKWYVVDAKEKTLGRISTEIANLLRGKGKPDFAPHLDTGDGVIVVNAAHISLTGNKWAQKKYYSHSGYLGGLKSISAEKMLEKSPNEIIRQSVSGMIPKNRLKKGILLRLRIFSESEHDMTAQKPIPTSF